VAMRDKEIPQDEWNSLYERLDVLGREIDRPVARPVRIEESKN